LFEIAFQPKTMVIPWPNNDSCLFPVIITLHDFCMFCLWAQIDKN